MQIVSNVLYFCT